MLARYQTVVVKANILVTLQSYLNGNENFIPPQVMKTICFQLSHSG